MKKQLQQAQASSQVVLVRATSKQGNEVERYGRVDQLSDTAVTIELLNRSKKEFRAVPLAQITSLLVGDDATAAASQGTGE
ncbi:hypothetical protein [Deinococcus yunweiensis]|uniref:hypothetical protein n=1 Tax=Deinococcus yunweiensis TaxID=367282 RepID=UPI00398EB9C2